MKKKLKKKLTSCLLIQTFSRQYLAKKLKKKLTSCLLIQSCFDSISLRKTFKNLTHQKRRNSSNKIKVPLPPLCRNYISNIVCPFGDTCRFSHGNKDTRFLNRTYDQTPCWNGVFCHKKDCPYLH